jgi:hypothetical protein
MIRLLRGACNLAAFCLGIAAAATILSSVVEPSRVTPVSAKLDWLAEREDFDTILIGSSRTHRQLLPTVLDPALAEAGVQINSFNLSTDGMRPPEDGYLIDRALEERDTPLRFLIVEANPIELRIADDNEDSERVVYWHDLPRMMALWSRAWSASIARPPALDKRISDTWRNLRYFSEHLSYWVTNAVLAGRGSELIHEAIGLAPTPRDERRDLGPDLDGHLIPRGAEEMDPAEMRDYDRKFSELKRKGRRLDPGDYASQSELLRKARKARQFGARLVLVAPPSMNVEIFRPEPTVGKDVIFLDFSDPAKYPDLFVAEHRRDSGHLNTKGSVLYTRLVAQHLAAALREKP